MANLFDEFKLGTLTLRNRMVMAPLTRNRTDRHGLPGPLAATYYAQRATAGLIISEGMQPSAMGQGWCTPGIHTDEQVAAWRQVTGAVHAAGGLIFAQLMHYGRVSHPALLPQGRQPLAPSAVRAEGIARTDDGPAPFVTPLQMSKADIAETVGDFAASAANAVAAGFDGVELHAASGLLLHQFLADGPNRRDDAYGGSVTGRIRFIVEVTAAVAAAVGAGRVGLRVSPASAFNDIAESDPAVLYPELARRIGEIGIAFLHVYETGDRAISLRIREAWPATFILNPHPADRRAPASYRDAQQALAEGAADLIAFGRLFISNPDLPARFRAGLRITPPDPATFYGGDHRGYIDYPALTSE
jgi:N-ethylmaleimide reductase